MAQALGMFKRRFEHFVKHAHRLPSMVRLRVRVRVRDRVRGTLP